MTLAKGLYPVKEEMPYSPTELYITKYELGDTLGNWEAEEWAARILSFSIDVGQWVGVSGELLERQLQDDLDASIEISDAKQRERQNVRSYEWAKRKRFWLAFFTLGVALIFTKKPVRAAAEFIPDEPCRPSIFLTHPHAINRALREHVQHGWTHIELVGIDLVYFPTLKLIEAAKKFRLRRAS